jgi:uncharacterized Zn finger protein
MFGLGLPTTMARHAGSHDPPPQAPGPVTLAGLLSRQAVRRRASSSSLERGEGYASAGAVRITEQGPERVAARVQGSRRYDVLLTEEDGELAYECTCPMGEQGHFCKHCVAVAAQVAGWGTGAKQTKPAETTMEDVREHLLSWDKPALVDLILGRAREDDRLRDDLLLRVALRRADAPDVETLRDALEVDDHASRRESWDWSHGVDRVVDAIEELLEQGHARTVVDLCEEALELLGPASDMVDHSHGSLAPLVERLGTLHLEACRSGAVDPVALGQRLVELELGSRHEAFYGAIDDYAEVLGEAGLAAYREAADWRWSGVRALGPGESDRDGSADRFRITRIMERLADLTGGVDDVVAVLSRDLSSGYKFLRIAEVLRDAGRFEDALAWAERGLVAFPGRADRKLREFAAAEHHRGGRHDEAMKLIWAEFEERPGLDSYQRLREHASVAGADRPAWSDRALAFLRQQIGRQSAARRSPYSWEGPADRSSLVEIFLWRNELEAAWREAQEGGCREDLWMRLADLRQEEHPGDAVPIYQRQVEFLLSQGRAYDDAVAMMRRVRSAMSSMEPPGDFGAYVTALRAAHRRKRNFMALLQQAGW